MSFPDGYDTDLGQGGVNVSGGQKQRLCIARALLKNPKILILDDSTSAVDSRTDESIRAAFRESLPGTTKLIIAQRIASIMYSDRIIVMDKDAFQMSALTMSLCSAAKSTVKFTCLKTRSFRRKAERSPA